MIPIDISTDAERAWRRQASALGQEVDAYLCRILDTGEYAYDVSAEAFDRDLDALAADVPPGVSLPADFSRADIYTDHN